MPRLGSTFVVTADPGFYGAAPSREESRGAVLHGNIASDPSCARRGFGPGRVPSRAASHAASRVVRVAAAAGRVPSRPLT